MNVPLAALKIWQAGLEAVKPSYLVPQFFNHSSEWFERFHAAERIIVIGAGKAGRSMTQAFWDAVPEFHAKLQGIVNVPDPDQGSIGTIQLHGARPSGSNHPTEAGVHGAQQMLEFVQSCASIDIVICLISGGGSALLPLPVAAITLAEKQQVTKLLHHCGASIDEMNCIRKHLSQIKGGKLAQAFHGQSFHTLILSDVIGDPLDVIASGPTVADTSTFSQALSILEKYQLQHQVPPNVWTYLQLGLAGQVPETCKELPSNVYNHLIGNADIALSACEAFAQSLGYTVMNLGATPSGDTTQLAHELMPLIQQIQSLDDPIPKPACILLGGETTVQLNANAGKGGRNQEFVLALAECLNLQLHTNITLLSAGTDGEDGPTDAAGAWLTAEAVSSAKAKGLHAADYLHRHDSYTFFDSIGTIFKTGLTGTNVMDIRLILIDESLL